MSVKTVHNNGKNISEKIVKMELEKNFNFCCIIIWSTYGQRRQIFDFLISLPGKTENPL